MKPLRRFCAALLLAWMPALVGATAAAAEPWPRSDGDKASVGNALPERAECALGLELAPGHTLLVCRQPGAAGVALWSRRSEGAATRFTRELGLPGAAGARLAWHRGPGAAGGLLLVDAFDDYCRGTTVMTIDAQAKLRVAGRIPELVERDGEAQCVGSIAAVRGEAARAELVIAAPLQRQTAAGEYREVKPAVVYRVVGGQLKREAR